MTEIRLAEEQDLQFVKAAYQKLDAAMMKLYGEIVNLDGQDDCADDLHTDEYWMNLIENKSGYILIGSVDGVQAGMAVVENVDEHECHLEDLYVCEQYRNRGIGRSLVSDAKKMAAEKGYSNMSLNVLPNNGNAIGLYKEFGFVDTRIRMNCEL